MAKVKKQVGNGVSVLAKDAQKGVVYVTPKGRLVSLETYDAHNKRVFVRMVDDPVRPLVEIPEDFTMEGLSVETEGTQEGKPVAEKALASITTPLPALVPPQVRKKERPNISGKHRNRPLQTTSARTLVGAEIIKLRDKYTGDGLQTMQLREKVKGHVGEVLETVGKARPDLVPITLYTTFYSLVSVLIP